MRIPCLSLALATVVALPFTSQAQGLTPLLPSSVNGVAQSMPITVSSYTAPDGRVFVLAGPMMMELRSHSVRSPSFRLVVERAGGKFETLRPGPVRSYRGHILGVSGAKVAGSLLHDGFHARIVTKTGADYWIQPDRNPNAAKAAHILYRADDTVANRKSCGTDNLKNPQIGKRNLPPASSTSPAAFDVAEIACDADFEYYQDHGSNTTQVTNRIESVINTMNVQYESEVNVTHSITTTLIRTSSSQPYTSTDAVTLLNQMRSHWNANHTNVNRDIAHLFTGKSIDGGTIGIAWIGVICHPTYGYGLVESDFNNNFACATDLSAHELGHNWNAQHCGCRRNTMNSYITCANSFHERRTRPTIAAFRDSLSCLGSGGGGGTATSVSASVTTTTANVGGGRRVGRAVVTVTDDLGNAVAGATVEGAFSGAIIEGGFSDTTNGNGQVTFQTSASLKGKFSVTFCVSKVTATLQWQQQGNDCDSN